MSALGKKDFVSDQDVRWCPGCGDYAILSQVQKVLPELGVARENFVFVSGIGCSSRFPYYVNTYGFHSIHGRAPAIATGLKSSRPELSVWVITGDGDALSIGGNHVIHILRRNVDVNILLFNNKIYGLTKGQYSPTSEVGKVTKSTPVGSVDHPFDPIALALGAEASFVARSVDVDILLFNNKIYGLTKGQYSPTSEVGKVTKSTPVGSVDHPFDPIALALGAEASFVARSVDVETRHLQEIVRRAHEHKGASFVEVLQNCNVFNDGAFNDVTDKATKADATLVLEHGKPLVFGKNRDKGIRLRDFQPEVVQLGDGVSEADLLVHDEHNPALAYLIARLGPPRFPTPIGVFTAVDRPCYEDVLNQQVAAAKTKASADLATLLKRGDVWTVT